MLSSEYVYLRNAKAGKWTVVTEAREGARFFTEMPNAEPGARAGASTDKTIWKVSARSSHEENGWGTPYLQGAPSAAKGTGKGYSSKGNSTADTEEWIEIDLGSEHALKGMTLHPRMDTRDLQGGSAGFPVDYQIEARTARGEYRTIAGAHNMGNPRGKPVAHDFYTVVGFPTARFLRLRATRLGSPASDEPAIYRLQFSGIEVQW